MSAAEPETKPQCHAQCSTMQSTPRQAEARAVEAQAQENEPAMLETMPVGSALPPPPPPVGPAPEPFPSVAASSQGPFVETSPKSSASCVQYPEKTNAKILGALGAHAKVLLKGPPPVPPPRGPPPALPKSQCASGSILGEQAKLMPKGPPWNRWDLLPKGSLRQALAKHGAPYVPHRTPKRAPPPHPPWAPRLG